MRVPLVRALGLAAFVAAARAAWVHHLDNQAVIRTDLMRECFAAGQAAERTRAAEEADTARRASYLPGAGQPWSAGWSTTYSPGPPPTLTVLPPGMEEPDFFTERYGYTERDEPEGSGWTEWDDEHRNGPGVTR